MVFLEFVKVFFSKLLTLETGEVRPPLRIEVKLDLGILPLMTLRLPKSSTASVFTKFRPPLIWRKNSQLQEVKFEQSLFWFSQGVDFRFQIYRNQHDQNHATLLLAAVSHSFVTKLFDEFPFPDFISAIKKSWLNQFLGESNM